MYEGCNHIGVDSAYASTSAFRSKHGGGTVMGQKFVLGVGVWWLVNIQGIVSMMVSLSLQREARVCANSASRSMCNGGTQRNHGVVLVVGGKH